jgi:hypothetical protein
MTFLLLESLMFSSALSSCFQVMFKYPSLNTRNYQFEHLVHFECVAVHRYVGLISCNESSVHGHESFKINHLSFCPNTQHMVFPNYISHFFIVVSGFWCAWMTWMVIIFHSFPAFQKSWVPLKNMWTRHTVFTVSLSQWLKSVHLEFLQFDAKLDVTSLLTFWIRHSPTKHNASVLKHLSTAAE